MYHVIYCIDKEYVFSNNLELAGSMKFGRFIYGTDTRVIPGGSKLVDDLFMSDGSYSHIYVEGFAWKIE